MLIGSFVLLAAAAPVSAPGLRIAHVNASEASRVADPAHQAAAPVSMPLSVPDVSPGTNSVLLGSPGCVTVRIGPAVHPGTGGADGSGDTVVQTSCPAGRKERAESPAIERMASSGTPRATRHWLAESTTIRSSCRLSGTFGPVRTSQQREVFGRGRHCDARPRRVREPEPDRDRDPCETDADADPARLGRDDPAHEHTVADAAK